MPEFMPEPCLTLETKEDVIAALADTSWKDQPYPYEYRVKSVWLISLIEEIIATTGRYFAYNSEVKRLAEQRLGYPAQNDAYYSKENNPLSTLIYNAQCYQRSDKLRAAGYQPMTQALIEEAFAKAAKIEIISDSLLGGPRPVVLNAREIGGKVYAMQPRKRKYHIAPGGQPAKII
jgi:hypothetical protein